MDYLIESETKLFESFREFRICADIRNLEDKFKQAFNPIKASVDLGNFSEIKSLISELEDHERLVFDMIQSTWSNIRQEINASPSKINRSKLEDLIKLAIQDSENKQKQVKEISHSIIDKL